MDLSSYKTVRHTLEMREMEIMMLNKIQTQKEKYQFFLCRIKF